jgi:hypothetical protein
MTDQIHTFRTYIIALHRPIKQTYYMLEWNPQNRKWVSYFEPLENLHLCRSRVSIDGIVRINIASAVNKHARNIQVMSKGYYLESGNTQITLVEKVGPQLPAKFMKTEYRLTDNLLTETDILLWLVAPPPPPPPPEVEDPEPQLMKPLPKRIAWLIAEDSSKAQDTCPISTEVISPVTAAVTTCFHVFDNASIAQWFTMNPVNTKCPVCREVCLMTKAFE